MYAERLQGIDDNDKEELYAFSIVIREIMKLIFNDENRERYYKELYDQFMNKSENHIWIGLGNSWNCIKLKV